MIDVHPLPCSADLHENRLSPLPRIAVTMGDPAGVGPEICLRLLADDSIARLCTPVVFGDADLLARVAGLLELPYDAPVLTMDRWATCHQDVNLPTVLHLPGLSAAEVVPGKLDAQCGEAAYRYVSASIEAGLAGTVQAVTTGPLNKEALHLAGHRFPGHTEIFAERMQADRWCMMLTSEAITCSFVTAHVGYHQVPELLTVERIVEVIDLTAAAMRRIRGREPKLVVCVLNPHAGEHGLFGQREEERIIVPAMETAHAAGIQLEGPLPPDTCFLPWRRAETDAYICMYHDQGHIPLKALAFDLAINTTLGLPVVRTSVDHGTAFDIAWQGKASASSLFEAVKLAARLCSTS